MSLKISSVGQGQFKVSKNNTSVFVDFSPFMRSLNLKVGDRFLFQHWNKVSGCFGIYDLGSDLYFCEYNANTQISQRGQFWWRMVEVSASDTQSPLIACNYCRGYSSVIQLPHRLILVGEGE